MAEVSEKNATAAAAQNSAALSTPSQKAAPSTSTSKSAPGLVIRRFFTKAGQSAFDQVEWELRTASITDASGGTIFEQKNVETPKDWSMTATNIVASKYLHGTVGTPERESGVRALITRVADTISKWGYAQGYFRTDEDADTFHEELVHLLVHQKMAFNSPVWFNVGCDKLEPNSDAQSWHWDRAAAQVKFGVTGYRNPQCSACFINSVKDSLDSILTLAKTEGMLFKWGSGTGTNLSPLRSSNESLSGGGTASGPLSFMRGFDAFAGVIKSGGKTRRAAKMVILNVEHPDIVEFIECKVKEEAKAWTLMQAGYDGSSPDSEAYSSIFFQNANNSVRVTDEFMHAVEKDGDFFTKAIKDGRPVRQFRARDLMNKIAEATWQCGDPGMQYDTTVNKWHTSRNTGRINASNPCSEYMFLDDSACNLASLNLMKFAPNGQFDIEAYKHAVDITITAQEILVDNSGYPTESIGRNSHDYRPLGLGYANLGALLMASGLPYDSDAGRDYAACITAIMCGQAYLQSARIAELCPSLAPATELTQTAQLAGGACPGFYVNREPFLDVIRMHRASVNNIAEHRDAVAAQMPGSVAAQMDAMIEASKSCWDQALAHGERHGYRNSQMSVLAPTGTIGFMMDCDTTGIEPDLALVKYKKLVGGGMIKIVNNTVPTALFKLGYSSEDASNIVSYIDATGTIEGAPSVKDEHLPVFDCSFKPAKGTRSIHYLGHVKMMAAAQPFISGAISKTVNLPNNATVDDIAEAYLESWRLGLKAVAIYRDGSKGSQPLNVSSADGKTARTIERAGQAPTPATSAADNKKEIEALLAAALQQDTDGPPRAIRHRLPDERLSVTHKFGIAGHEGYINVGLYKNGQPGEIFIRMAKEGSTVSGLMDCFATSVSIALQHGVPLRLLCEKFSHTRFEPSGWTQNSELGFAKSIMDYIFRWLQLRFIDGQQQTLFEGLMKPKSALYSGPETEDAATDAGLEIAANVKRINAGAQPDLPIDIPNRIGSRGDASAPQGGIAPEPGATSTDKRQLTLVDRGATHHVHAADALRGIVDLGDAPSCHVCGAIMTRNGSCYRCMECGSTSGCS